MEGSSGISPCGIYVAVFGMRSDEAQGAQALVISFFHPSSPRRLIVSMFFS